MKIFEKKFRVRVRHFKDEYFCIEYSYTWKYLPPIWRRLLYWFEQSVYANTEGWSTRLFRVDSAETYAKKLKSISDIKKLDNAEIDKRSDFYRRRAESKDKIPYQVKNIL